MRVKQMKLSYVHYSNILVTVAREGFLIIKANKKVIGCKTFLFAL
ncbi:hypothetical protein R0131_04375 [Clostridium sp. AL.422]|nr:hypothetical protein [Clostridium sp. AL.422]